MPHESHHLQHPEVGSIIRMILFNFKILSPSGSRLSWNKHTLCNRVCVCPQGAANRGIKPRRLLVSRQKPHFTAGAVGSSVSGWQIERKWKNLEVLFQGIITPKTINYQSSTGNRRLPSEDFRCLGSWRTRTYPWQPLLCSGCLQLFGAFWIKSPHLHGVLKFIYLFFQQRGIWTESGSEPCCLTQSVKCTSRSFWLILMR